MGYNAQITMSLDPSGFHFAYPLWLYALLVPVILWLLPPGQRVIQEHKTRLRRYADEHLLPHLLMQPKNAQAQHRRSLLLWMLLWCLGILAMAGPRWNFTDVQVFQPGSDVVILFDLSRSMSVSDVKPSRLARARQEVSDLIETRSGVRMGMVIFATVAHVVAPITDDTQTLQHVLGALDTDMVQLQGSRLSHALERAEQLLAAQPAGNSRSILLLSDGDFPEPDLLQRIAQLRQQQGIRFYVMGLGTPEGGRVPSPRGDWMLDAQGKPVISPLAEAQLQALAQAGNGLYVRAHYQDADTQLLLGRIQSDAPPILKSNPIRVWYERYYLPVLLMVILLLLRFRRGAQLLQG